MYMVGYGRVRHGAFFNYFRVQKRVWVWMGECVSEWVSVWVSVWVNQKMGRDETEANETTSRKRWDERDMMWCDVVWWFVTGRKRKSKSEDSNCLIQWLLSYRLLLSHTHRYQQEGTLDVNNIQRGGETGERKLHQLQERRFEMDPQSNREF